MSPFLGSYSSISILLDFIFNIFFRKYLKNQYSIQLNNPFQGTAWEDPTAKDLT